MAVVECRLLGDVEVRFDGAALEVGPARQRCVLAGLLVDANRTVTVDTLAERVWGERQPNHARRALYSYVSRLRTAVAAAEDLRIRHATGGYVLTVDPDAVDLHRFRRLVSRAGAATDDAHVLALLDEALALWRGEMCAGLDSPWLAGVRRLVQDERLAAELDRNDVALRLGRHIELLPDLTVLTDDQPWNERAAGQLMLALHRSGRQAEALDIYAGIRRRLAEELGIDPAPPLVALHEQLLHGATDLPPATGTPRSRLHELPADVPDFTGRHAEIEYLTADGDTAAVLAIDGMPGVGKTALAVHVAHHLTRRYPDAQLFADLCGYAPGHERTAPADALGALLRALAVPGEQIPATLPERAALWRSELADRRALVVLDNAADAAQVRPLLPGAGQCLTLITSRRRLLDLDTTRVLSLEPLAQCDAVTLFVNTAGANRTRHHRVAVEQAVALCGRVPLAVRVAAARLRSRPAWSVPDLVTRLSHGECQLAELTAGDRSMSAAIGLSYAQLPPDQQRLFRLLALHPGPSFDADTAAALAALDPATVGSGLEDLLDAHLLRQDTPSRYRFHDLLRLYARSALQDNETPTARADAEQRLLRYYLNAASAAERLRDPHESDLGTAEPAGDLPCPSLATPQQALHWLEANCAGLLAVHRLAARRGEARLVAQLSVALDGFLMYSGRLADNLANWQRALTLSEHVDDQVIRFRTLRRCGRAYAQLGRYDEAIDHVRQALDVAEETGDTRWQGQAHFTLAIVWEEHGDDRHALWHAQQALRQYEKLGNPVLEARVRNAVGWYHARSGEFQSARRHCAAALSTFQAHHNAQGQADTLDSLAYIEHRTGHHRDAISRYREALALYRELGDAYSEANTLHRLGDVHADLDEAQAARRAWQEARALYESQRRISRRDQLDSRMATSLTH